MRMIKCGWKIFGGKFLRKGNYNHDGSKLYYASINSSGAHPPPPLPSGKREAFTLVVSPGGGGALANFIAARGLGISILRIEPRAFDTRVFERWMSLSGRMRPLS